MARHIHIDESPIRFERWLQRFPQWLQRFLPSSGGRAEDHHGKGMFGFTVFLLSESIIFLSFIFTYAALRATVADWLPAGVAGPELTHLVLINTVVLLSSSLVIQWAERTLKQDHINRFRGLWFTASLMGSYFLVGQAIEWRNLDFGLTTGVGGGAFYVLTGFHGLHVLAGVMLQLIMLVRSFRRGNYDNSYFGVNTTTLFWHFVDGIWIILFSLIYL